MRAPARRTRPRKLTAIFLTSISALSALIADLADGKMIESVSYSGNSFTLHFTDGTTQVIPLPIATLTYRGEWQNSNVYVRGDMVSVHNVGFFQVLVDHTTPPLPAAV